MCYKLWYKSKEPNPISGMEGLLYTLGKHILNPIMWRALQHHQHSHDNITSCAPDALWRVRIPQWAGHQSTDPAFGTADHSTGHQCTNALSKDWPRQGLSTWFLEVNRFQRPTSEPTHNWGSVSDGQKGVQVLRNGTSLILGNITIF